MIVELCGIQLYNIVLIISREDIRDITCVDWSQELINSRIEKNSCGPDGQIIHI